MYILPLLFWNLHSMDPNFMTDLSPVDRFPSALELPFINNRGHHYDPWNLIHRAFGPNNEIVEDKDNIKFIINVKKFKPEEVSVKVANRWLVVEAKHEEKKGDRNIITRYLKKTYLLPDRADVDKVTSNISKDGVLTIVAPLKPEDPKDEKEIKIELTEESAKDHGEGEGEGETVTNPSTEKNVEENDVREELTTQGYEEKEKPEK